MYYYVAFGNGIVFGLSIKKTTYVLRENDI